MSTFIGIHGDTSGLVFQITDNFVIIPYPTPVREHCKTGLGPLEFVFAAFARSVIIKLTRHT